MLSVEHLESLPGQGAEPEEERDLGLLGELAGPAGEIEEGLLEDIGGIEPALEAAVQAQADHPLESLPVAVPELPKGVRIPGRGLPQQRDRVVRVVHRRGVHTPGTAKVRRPSTDFLKIFFCEQLPEGVNLQVALGEEPLRSGVLLLEASLPSQFGDSHAAVAAPPAVEGVYGDAVVAAELADGLLADFGLPEDVDDLRLAEPALAHRIRSLAWADSTISGGPVFGGQVRMPILGILDQPLGLGPALTGRDEDPLGAGVEPPRHLPFRLSMWDTR
jgi:hypothetical protein